MITKILMLLFSLSLILSACAPATPVQEAGVVKTEKSTTDKAEETMMDEPVGSEMETSAEEMAEEPTEAMEPTATSSDDQMEDESMALPDWFGATLSDVRTVRSFTIDDFMGKVILVETLAMWCPSCKRQQGEVKNLLDALGMREDLVSIGLDIDPNENATDLKTYVENNSFDWLYAIAPVGVAREIAQLYGDQFLNPSSTPILIIDRHGQAHPLPFGIKSADELIGFIQPFLDADM